jgi:hypothetical protein
MSGERTERVFISYSHDSPAHEKRVLDLANQLRREGVDAWIDRYEPHPAEGWPRWMQNQIDSAAFILAVCTPTYCRRFEGHEKPGQGLGVSWEGMLANQMLYQNSGLNERIAPVLFEDGGEAVPKTLQPFTRYRLPDGYEQLYRRLTNQPEVVPPPLGPRIELPTLRGLAKALRPELPAMPASSEGAPDPTKLESPFIVGPPIEKPEHFFGRSREIEEIRHALREHQPIQLVGETRMGKTSLLNRVPDHLPGNYPVAKINAQGLAGHSPKKLLLAIASCVGRRATIESIIRDDRPDTILLGLDKLLPCAILLDEADALAQAGHAFDRSFFDHCRTRCQDHKLLWVSASYSDLESLFAKSGLTSRFLNDSKKICVGQLDSAGADALVRVLGPSLASRAREQAGRFAMGLQWLGHEMWKSGDQPLLADDFANAMHVHFERWWEKLDQEDRRLLKRYGAGVAISGLGDGERRRLRALEHRGLVEQENSTFQLPGTGWRSFVGDAE